MAAGLADYRARGKDARPLDEPLVDGLLQAEHRATHVADRGEAPHQDRACLDGGPRGDVIRIVVAQRSDGHGDGGVDVGVDQARDHDPVTGIDDARRVDPLARAAAGVAQRDDAPCRH